MNARRKIDPRPAAVLAAAALSIALGAAAGAAADDPLRWEGRLEPGATLTIRTLRGDIVAEPAAGRVAEVTARKSGGGDHREVEVRMIEDEGGLTVCTVHPGHDRCSGRHQRDSERRNRTEVDVTVRLPAGVLLRADTEIGSIEARGLAAPVEARTVIGDVEVGTSAYASAESINGDIDVRIGSAAWDGDLELRSINGDIEVSLPEGADVELRADTQTGSFSSQGLAIASPHHGGRIPGARVRGTLGDGGRTLTLETTNGSIRLRQHGEDAAAASAGR